MLTERFFRNLEIFSRFCPDLHDKILFADIQGFRPPSLFFNEENQIKKCLETSKVLNIIGVGNGESFFVFKKWLEENEERRVIFFENDVQILRSLLDRDVGTLIMHHKQIYFCHAEVTGRMTTFKPDEILILNIRVPMSLHISEYFVESRRNEANDINEDILLFVRTISQLSVKNEIKYLKNLYYKIAELPFVKKAISLKNAFKDIPAIIVGAGPSLKEDVEGIKRLKNRALIFGAGTGLNVLNHHGIMAHFGGGLDPTLTQKSRVSSNSSYETAFIYADNFSWEALHEIHGPKLYTPMKADESCRIFFRDKNIETLDFEGESTSNYLTVIALMLGCNPIGFSGMDMGYTEGKRYSDGVKAHATDDAGMSVQIIRHHHDAVEALNYEGKVFKTTMTFILESAYVTLLSDRYPHVTFFNSSLEGLGYNKIERIPLKNSRFFSHNYDLEGHLHSVLTMADSLDYDLEMIKTELHNFKSDINSALELLTSDKPLPESDRIYKLFHPLIEKLNKYKTSKYYFPLTYHEEGLTEEERTSYADEVKNGYKTCFINQLKKHKRLIDRALYRKPFFMIEGSQSGTISYFEDRGDLQKEVLWDGKLIHYFKKHEGQFEGDSIFCTKEKAILAKCTYVKGKKEGPAFYYGLKGNLEAKLFFKEDVFEGRQVYYYPNGNLKSELDYKEGQPHGKVILYFPDGAIKKEIHFSRGKKEGIERGWAPNHALLYSSEYKNGVPCGKTVLYYPSGLKSKEVHFNYGGEMTEARLWDREGNIRKEQTNLNPFDAKTALNKLEALFDENE